MATGVRDLKVWQEAVLLGGEVVKAMRQGTRREVKAFTDHAMQSAVGIAASIAEGYGHYTNVEQRTHFSQARRLLALVETEVAVARQAGLVTPAVQASIGVRINTVSRLLTGYLSYLERQIAVEQEANQAARPIGTPGTLVSHPSTPGQIADRATQ